MTLLHRAYAFAHSAFRAELAPILEAALSTGEGAALARFIDEHLQALSDPLEGEPLAEGWRESVGSDNLQELAGLALTKYYDGDLEMGLDIDWLEVKDELTHAGADASLLLGTPFGPAAQPFDPSGQGSYFQTEGDVERALATVQKLAAKNVELAEAVAPLLG